MNEKDEAMLARAEAAAARIEARQGTPKQEVYVRVDHRNDDEKEFGASFMPIGREGSGTLRVNSKKNADDFVADLLRKGHEVISVETLEGRAAAIEADEARAEAAEAKADAAEARADAAANRER